MATKKKPPKNKPDPNATPAPATPEAEAKLTRFQTFEKVRIHRRQILNAPYNPRVISDENRAQLRAALDVDNGGVGLITSITWNVASSNIVGGHQRLAQLDALEGTDNYLLDVDKVNLTEAQEVEQNIALNNPNLQGDWDMPLLENVLKSTEGLNLRATGFTLTDIKMSFEDPKLASLFAPNEPTKALLGEVEAMQADGKKPGASSARRAADGSSDGADEPREREVMKRTRAENAENYDNDDTEFHLTCFFADRAEREAFVEAMGAEPDERYIDGAKLIARLGIKLPKKAAPPAATPPRRVRKAK